MALVKLSTASQMSGKIGGNVYAANRYGSYVRKWSKPINPQTNAQVAIRSRLSAANDAWFNLSSDQQSAWNTYAAAIPWTNRLGDTIYLTGKSMFTRTYIARANAGLPMVSDGPTVLLLPVVPALTFTLSSVLGTLEVSWSGTQPWTETGGGLALYVSDYKSNVTTYIDVRSCKYCATFIGSSTPPLTSPQSYIIPGLANNVGNKIMIALRMFTSDGRVSSMYSEVMSVPAT